MPVFAIIPQPNPNTAKLAGVIATLFGTEFRTLQGADKGWLVSTKGTAQELSAKLGVTSGENGAAIIIEIASYFGRATPDIWSWIKEKMESPTSG
jgi:hypothetical protein